MSNAKLLPRTQLLAAAHRGEFRARAGGRGAPRVLLAIESQEHLSRTQADLADAGCRIRRSLGPDDLLRQLEEFQVDVLILDRNYAGQGLELCRQLRERARTLLLPIMMLGNSDEDAELEAALDAGADEYLVCPVTRGVLLAHIFRCTAVKVLTDSMDDSETVLFTLARLVEARDPCTGNHCDRLAHYCTKLAEWLALESEDVVALRRGGVMHDIGKLAIPDSILLKAGSLTPEEWEVMRCHPAIGAQLCESLRSMQRTIPIIRHHHERWNGTGYPDRLAGEGIPFLARAFQIVDIFDALRSERPYKPSWPLDRVVRQLQEEVDQQLLDPTLTAAFIDLIRAQPEEFEAGAVPALGQEGLLDLVRRVWSPAGVA